jgi:hypothetical protein
VSSAPTSCAYSLLERSTNALAFGEASLPIIPVALRFDETRSKWIKQPCVSWELATTDAATIDGWWRTWPDAIPGIPLRAVGWAVVDAEGAEGTVEVTGIGPLGPHSRITTPSGGTHLVFAQPPEAVTRFQWSANVEVLGTSSLLTCYDLDELLFPRVAPRAVLPKMFWKAKGEDGSKGVPINKTREEHAAIDAAMVATLTDALFRLDVEDWRGRHDEWLALANGCKFEGISEDECPSSKVISTDRRNTLS